MQVGDRYYVKATATLIQRGGGKSELAADVNWFAQGWAREELDKKGMDAAQITGAASSYARKYALNGLFCIDDTKDADHGAAVEAATAPKTAPQRTETSEAATRVKAAKDRILANLKRLGENPKTKEEVAAAVKKYTGAELKEMNYDEIGEVLGKIADKK